MTPEKARVHLAWLIWCYQEGYVKPEDREILTNWINENVAELSSDDVELRDGLLAMADEILALL